MKNKKLVFAFHVHHEILLEPLTEPFKNRVQYIKTAKPKEEQELRLRLFKKVRGKLPPNAEWSKAYAELSKADAELSKADAEWSKADAEWSKARAELSKARAEWFEKNKARILALHKKECPNCPWDGKTIFPKEILIK